MFFNIPSETISVLHDSITAGSITSHNFRVHGLTCSSCVTPPKACQFIHYDNMPLGVYENVHGELVFHPGCSIPGMGLTIVQDKVVTQYE